MLDWAALHKQELLENWERARQRQPLNRIAPLESQMDCDVLEARYVGG